MRKFKFVVLVASACILMSSCNLLNFEIDNIGKDGDTTSDLIKLTISGQVSNYGGEFDEMRVYDDINFKYKKILGTCYILSNGSFTLNLQAKVDISDTIGSDTIGWALFPPPQTADERKVMTTGFNKIYAYKKGTLVGSIVKGKQIGQLPTDYNYYESTFPYSTKAYSGLGSTWTDSEGRVMVSSYNIKKGWSEIVTHIKSNYSTNPPQLSGEVTDSVYSDMQWVFSKDTTMYLFYIAKDQAKCYKR
jgi:hypothetical protein